MLSDLFPQRFLATVLAANTCINSLSNAYCLLKMGSFQKAGKFLIKGSAVIRDVIWEAYVGQTVQDRTSLEKER